jgi:hypothetical protein
MNPNQEKSQFLEIPISPWIYAWQPSVHVGGLEAGTFSAIFINMAQRN